MKKLLISLFTVTVLAGGAFADKTAEQSRFFGKIVSVDTTQRNMTVHNYKKKSDETFRWDDKTAMTFNNRSISASDLKVGQSLMVSYVARDDGNQATKISVRTPFKKSAKP